MKAIFLFLFLKLTPVQEQLLWVRYDSLLKAGNADSAFKVAMEIAKNRGDKNVFLALYGRAISNKRQDLAIKILDQGRKFLKKPYLYSVHFYNYYIHKGNIRRAIYEIANIPLERGKNAPDAWIYKQTAILARRIGYKSALEVLERWQKANPESHIGALIGVRLLLEQEDLKGAFKFAKKWKVGWLEIAEVAFKMGRFDMAKEALESATSADTSDSEGRVRWHSLMGKVKIEIGDTSAGLKELSIAAQNKDADARKLLVYLFLARGESDSAYRYATLRTERVKIAIFLGDYERALNELQKVKTAEDYYLLGLALALKGKTDSSTKVLRRLAFRNPDDLYANDALRIIMLLNKSGSGNSECVKKILQVERYALWEMYLKAANTLISLIGSCPDFKDFLLLRAGEFFERANDYGSAIGAYRQVKGELRPAATFQAFKLSLEIGETDMAKLYYQTLLNEYSDSPFTEMARGMVPPGGF